jgi:hypothetical protein
MAEAGTSAACSTTVVVVVVVRHCTRVVGAGRVAMVSSTTRDVSQLSGQRVWP